MLRFRDLGASFSSFGCFVFEFRVLRFRDLGASFSRFGCFVLRSSFSSASFSKLPQSTANSIEVKGRLYTTGKVIQRLFIIDLYT